MTKRKEEVAKHQFHQDIKDKLVVTTLKILQ